MEKIRENNQAQRLSGPQKSLLRSDNKQSFRQENNPGLSAEALQLPIKRCLAMKIPCDEER
jgi:hypothetical protein